MTDADIRALAERLARRTERVNVIDSETRDAEGRLCTQCHWEDRPDPDCVAAAAALTALMAERNEAREMAVYNKDVVINARNIAAEEARRAAFARAKEIASDVAEKCRKEARLRGVDLDPFTRMAAETIAAAIEAEMRSDEAQHSVKPLTKD